MDQLLQQIKACDICQPYLPHKPRPVMSASPQSKIIIIGQAPGSKVHQSGIPWQDPSGDILRKWLGVSQQTFYDATQFGIIPMGFCYPGKGKSGDLPPRPECAPQWHTQLFAHMHKIELILLIGQYAQKQYLQKQAKKNLTETVRYYTTYLPTHFPLPHPSPRNRFWLQKNPWFQKETIPQLQAIVSNILA